MLTSRLVQTTRRSSTALNCVAMRHQNNEYRKARPPIYALPKYDNRRAVIRVLEGQKKAYPFPLDPVPGNQGTDPKTQSDTWLNPRLNDGSGDRGVNLTNFHWRVHNALDLQALKELKAHLRRMDQGDYWVAAIFRAPDGYDFCPGADLVKLYHGDENYRKEFYRAAQEVAYYLATMRRPGFPVMQGNTMGLGAGLTMHSLFRLASESASWALPQVLHGSVPDMGMSYILPRLDGELGLYLALTGKRVEGSDIVRAGLATHFVTPHEMRNFELDTTRVEGDNLEDLLIIFQKYSRPLPEVTAIDKVMPDILNCFNKSTLPDIFAALEAEKSAWSEQILNRLRAASPLMLHITFRLQRIGRYLNSLDEALTLEYRVMQHVIKTRDFAEGILARVIEDREPVWEHASIHDVPEELVAKFFEPTGDELVLEPCSYGLRPSNDPYRILEKEVETLMSNPVAEHLVQRQLDRLFPRSEQTSENLKKFYRKLFKDGGMAEEGAAYFYKMHLMEAMNPDPIDAQSLHLRKPLKEIEEDEAASWDRTRFHQPTTSAKNEQLRER